MRRTNWKTVSTLVTMIVVAGCAENTASPSLKPSTTTAMRYAPAGHPMLSLNTLAGNATTSSFTVGPRGGTFLLGTNAIVFPKGSICDPKTTSDEPSAWGASCAPLTSSITVSYETTVLDGRTVVDFKTPLRFVPTSDDNGGVWLYMYTPAAKGATDLSPFTIYYAPTIGGPLFDESTTNPRLRTYVDTRVGVSARQIDHFSGYTSWGAACEVGTAGCSATP